eukprot:COSAG05_NODE_249_length_12903_cov_128.635505_13_plen_104_part_00
MHRVRGARFADIEGVFKAGLLWAMGCEFYIVAVHFHWRVRTRIFLVRRAWAVCSFGCGDGNAVAKRVESQAERGHIPFLASCVQVVAASAPATERHMARIRMA